MRPMKARGPKAPSTKENIEAHLANIEQWLKVNKLGFVSIKFDGIRALQRKRLLTRKLKLIPNDYIRGELGDLLDGPEGELILNQAHPPASYNENQSAIMSADGEPDFLFEVFDLWNKPDLPYYKRLNLLQHRRFPERVEIVEQHEVRNIADVLKFEELFLKQKYEGLMLRNPLALYKEGKATLKNFELVKLKRWADSEAVILGYAEQQENTNPKSKNELGYSKRSNKKIGMKPSGTMGALHVRDLTTDVEFWLPAGPTAEEKDHLWSIRHLLKDMIVSYSYLPAGVKERPRSPQMRGLRSRIDL